MLAGAPITTEELAALEAAGLGEVGAKLLRRIKHDRQEIDWRDAKLEKLSFEMAQLKRMKFGKKSEQFDAEQKALFDEAIDADIAATDARLQELLGKKKPAADPGEQPKRAAMPPNLPRVERHHEPENTMCACGCALKRIGEDVSEKLDYTPGVFAVERHIRGKWACAQCRTLTQAPVPAEIIDKGIPTSGLLAQVLVAKYADHLPLYRQEAIFGRAGVALPRSAPGRRVEGMRAGLPGGACRRDAGGDAGPRHRQDTSCLPVGLCRWCVRALARRRLRLHRDSRRRARQGVPW